MSQRHYHESKPSYRVLAEIDRLTGGVVGKPAPLARMFCYEPEQRAALLQGLEEENMVKVDGDSVSLTTYGVDTLIRYIRA